MGFDPGLINTGWGVLEKNNNSEKYIDHGCITTSKNEQLGKRLNLIYNKTLNLLRKYSPNAIAVEKIFANKNPESTLIQLTQKQKGPQISSDLLSKTMSRIVPK